MRIIETLKKALISKNFKKLVPAIAILVAVVSLITLMNIMRKSVTISVDGQDKKVVTYKKTVGSVINEAGIVLGKKDKTDKELSAQITNNETIVVKRAVDVNVLVDGTTKQISSAENNVAAMLKAEGIDVGADDKVNPSKDSKLDKDMKIVIDRIKNDTVTEVVPVDFETVMQNNGSVDKGVQNVLQQGSQGQKKVVSHVVYENGKQVSKDAVSTEVVKAPVNKVVEVGTREKPKNVIVATRGGQGMVYSKTFQVKSTAYSPSKDGAAAYTASGRRAVRDSNGYSTIAVDPSVIPIGTRLYVEGYGLAIAADTGGAIKGNFIDVFFNTRQEAMNWAVKYVKVYILQ